jgi:FkbM family methyltransferase
MEVKRFETVHGVMNAWVGDFVTQQLEEFSAHTRNELAMLGSLVREGDNIIDVGGHIGTSAIPFARFNGGRGKVFTFEPNPDNFELLLRNVAENGLGDVIVPVRAIVSEKPQRFRMVLPQAENTMAFCFLPDPDAPPPPDGAEPASVNLDEWMRQAQGDPPVALIKIDTEGAEMSVLRACRRIIERDRPVLYVEVNTPALARFGSSPADVGGFLEPLGYHLFRNIGARNSADDRFWMARLSRIEEGGDFFDVLAVHGSSPRYPRHYAGRLRKLKESARALIGRIARH